MARSITLSNGTTAWVYPPSKYDTRWRLRANGQTHVFLTEQALNEALATR